MALFINDLDIANLFQITNTMLHIVAPLYAAYNLFNLIFLILFSPHVLLLVYGLGNVEGIILANNLVLLLSYFGVASVLLVLSINKDCWNVNGDVILQSLFTFPFAKLQD
jgi:hypothetical protein